MYILLFGNTTFLIHILGRINSLKIPMINKRLIDKFDCRYANDLIIKLRQGQNNSDSIQDNSNDAKNIFEFISSIVDILKSPKSAKKSITTDYLVKAAKLENSVIETTLTILLGCCEKVGHKTGFFQRCKEMLPDHSSV